MLQKLAALKSKKGFTLMEMLIVIAIIAILAAVAIPTFSSQLTAAKQRSDDANLRAAESLAVSDYMLENRSDTVTYYFAKGTGGNIEIGAIAVNANMEHYNGYSSESTAVASQVTPANTISVTVNDAKITNSGWNVAIASSPFTGVAVTPTPTPTPAIDVE